MSYLFFFRLTDEVAKKNWQDYGNPDGPEAINFGIALPKWMITKENTVFVVAAYAIVFLLILPSVVVRPFSVTKSSLWLWPLLLCLKCRLYPSRLNYRRGGGANQTCKSLTINADLLCGMNNQCLGWM